MTDRGKITAELIAMGVPEHRAERKVAETGKGMLFVGLGVFLVLLGFGLAITVLLLTKASPSIPMIILCAAPALPGGYFLLAGGNLLSRDAMEAAEKSGGVITRTVAKALKPVRKNTIPPNGGD